MIFFRQMTKFLLLSARKLKTQQFQNSNIQIHVLTVDIHTFHITFHVAFYSLFPDHVFFNVLLLFNFFVNVFFFFFLSNFDLGIFKCFYLLTNIRWRVYQKN